MRISIEYFMECVKFLKDQLKLIKYNSDIPLVAFEKGFVRKLWYRNENVCRYVQEMLRYDMIYEVAKIITDFYYDELKIERYHIGIVRLFLDMFYSIRYGSPRLIE